MDKTYNILLVLSVTFNFYKYYRNNNAENDLSGYCYRTVYNKQNTAGKRNVKMLNFLA